MSNPQQNSQARINSVTPMSVSAFPDAPIAGSLRGTNLTHQEPIARKPPVTTTSGSRLEFGPNPPGQTPIDPIVQRFPLAEQLSRADHRAELDRQYLTLEFQQACSALVFCESLRSVTISANWPHATRFGKHIDRWVRVVGGHPSTANALVAFLDRFSAAFTTTQLVDWITISAAQTAELSRPEFWRRNGETIGALLLRLCHERPADFGDPALRTATKALAESLVTAEVVIAGEVRRAFEFQPATR
jgi:hypothetical protein